MTPQEIRDELAALRREVSANAGIFVHFNIDSRDKLFTASLYPAGVGKGDSLRAGANTLDDLLASLRAVWAESAERCHAERTRNMALAIIRITAEQGACTDAALRAGEFSAEEVARYGAEAVEDANDIASAGPFEIVRLAGANAA